MWSTTVLEWGGKKEFILELTVFRSLLGPRLPLSDTPSRTSRTRRHRPERVLGLGEEIRQEHYKRRKTTDSDEINSHSYTVHVASNPGLPRSFFGSRGKKKLRGRPGFEATVHVRTVDPHLSDPDGTEPRLDM